MIATPMADLDDEMPTDTILHETEPEPGHRCEPRIEAHCSECTQVYIYCLISDLSIVLLLEGFWLCAGCLLRCAPLMDEAAADLPIERPAWVTDTIRLVWADMAREEGL
jgi:hypothetical protein